MNTIYNFYFITDEEYPLSLENRNHLSSLKNLGEYNISFINPPTNTLYKNGKSKFGSEMRNQIQRFLIEDVLSNLDSVVYLDVDLILLRDLYDLQHVNLKVIFLLLQLKIY